MYAVLNSGARFCRLAQRACVVFSPQSQFSGCACDVVNMVSTYGDSSTHGHGEGRRLPTSRLPRPGDNASIAADRCC